MTDLTYTYPGATVASLRRVTATYGPGLTAVSGPSGGGKSTLLRVLNGLVPHFHGGRISGAAVVAGLDIIRTPTRRLARAVGFVFQDPELQTVYSVVDREVAFGLENLAVPQAQIGPRVEAALAEVGIAHLAGRRTAELSGGERQRVALASALALGPVVLALDEPTSQLDPDGARMVVEAVRQLARGGRAVVIAEHRLNRLLPGADGLFDVRAGEVRSADPVTWRPSPARRRRPGRAAGDESWWLDSVDAAIGGVTVLRDVTLNGRAGEVLALRGPNGGGKTTLLRILAGSVAATGRVERRPGRIAYLPQNPTSLLHRPTLLDEVRLTLDRAGEAESPREVLAQLGLLDLADRYPRDLSSGERQRAALAAVVPGSPAFVLLDEPTRGMDGGAFEALAGLVERVRDRGAAVIMATHDEELVSALADRVVEVRAGRVSEGEPPAAG
ncbi:MAG: ATP-binding cassette domain-containing protein [Candidatus Dormibacteraeota bacterium]|nr:ATP-binding cassette domain-containing protein [Candidatus Dormibacteraeota bacterium]